jgi:hypothetical protein
MASASRVTDRQSIPQPTDAGGGKRYLPIAGSQRFVICVGGQRASCTRAIVPSGDRLERGAPVGARIKGPCKATDATATCQSQVAQLTRPRSSLSAAWFTEVGTRRQATRRAAPARPRLSTAPEYTGSCLSILLDGVGLLLDGLPVGVHLGQRLASRGRKFVVLSSRSVRRFRLNRLD